MKLRGPIEDFSSRIVERFRPEKIVLFGSHARQSAGADSDVDLLVIMRHRGPAARQAALIRRAVPAPFALDLLVRSPQTIRQRLRLGDTFLRDVLGRGRIIYEAAGG